MATERYESMGLVVTADTVPKVASINVEGLILPDDAKLKLSRTLKDRSLAYALNTLGKAGWYQAGVMTNDHVKSYYVSLQRKVANPTPEAK